MWKRIPNKYNVILAALAAAFLTAPQASTSHRTGGTSATTPGSDTAYSPSYWDSTAGGTGPGKMPGRGGSSLDSAYGRDTLWSSPNDQPATPGTGLPNSRGNSRGSGLPGTGSPGSSGTGGSGLPGTGRPGSSGNGGSGNGGSGMGKDSSSPRDSIGATEWMERG